MFVTQNWYCAAVSSELGDKPLSRKIINEDIALFRDEEGKAHALGARCAHRGGDLSKGKCVNSTLECPWHGWRYDKSGHCTHIPSMGNEGRVPRMAKVPSYPVHEQQGFIYVWMNAEVKPDWRPEPRPFLDAPYQVRFGSRHQKGIFVHTLETALEDSHVAFAHSASIGRDIECAQLPPITNITKSDDGRTVTGELIWPEGSKTAATPFKRWLGKLLVGSERDGNASDKRYWVDISGLTVHEYPKEGGYRYYVFAYTTPVDEFHNRFFVGLADSDPNRGLINRWLSKLLMSSVFKHFVFHEDEDMISSALSDQYPGGHPKALFVKADAMGMAYRRMYTAALYAEGKEPAWPPVGPRPGPVTQPEKEVEKAV
ncbi:aromatic ring-hydroxylating dioxygenase subunit alpha [Pseudomaricurvus alkylphenolicus]|uniref:aromatic ring-hydroxylating dioxygenase subunit alpha n=1 Tax=Pseudomaricurvus alkylphenolicus TaxID=1306991 RepID=UPI001422C29C|nr:aromatic ring-hydroxylating dioxygenase subunit alpha [Pseudomaricurvus alkylphenolicus]NIB38537.1 aromatic ring-hydroxylating dioxygenase subunit alpha [Pseudomaricurvus alkylphenolicus]